VRAPAEQPVVPIALLTHSPGHQSVSDKFFDFLGSSRGRARPLLCHPRVHTPPTVKVARTEGNAEAGASWKQFNLEFGSVSGDGERWSGYCSGKSGRFG
jgi:hypothetical protein